MIVGPRNITVQPSLGWLSVEPSTLASSGDESQTNLYDLRCPRVRARHDDRI
jgi:hypothetical protein